MLALYVESIDAAPAYDVQFKVTGELPVSANCVDSISVFLEHGISLLMPGARRGSYLGVAHELIGVHSGAKAEISVSFARRRQGKRVLSKFPLDVISFNRSLLHTPLSLKRIEELVKQSKRMAGHFRQYGPHHRRMR